MKRPVWLLCVFALWVGSIGVLTYVNIGNAGSPRQVDRGLGVKHPAGKVLSSGGNSLKADVLLSNGRVVKFPTAQVKQCK